MNNKKCVFILPYFGTFKNYFRLFLNSFSKNPDYDLLIFTDNTEKYDYPENVRIIPYTLSDFKKNADDKFGFGVTLDTPYKLCDYKPTYGFLFEEYIADYPYWGYCDCDLIFGNLQKLLTPLLDEGYDKLFAAGHMTVFKNTFDNNRRFMKPFCGRELYKEALTTNNIFVFDEDCKCSFNPNNANVHSIFLNDGAKIFTTDLSMNPTPGCALFKRAFYSEAARTFEREAKPRCARYFWSDGNVVAASYNKDNDRVDYEEFLYIHLQLRKMRVKSGVEDAASFEILPDRFVKTDKLPQTKKEMRLCSINRTYLFWFDFYLKKIKNKLK